MVGSRTRRTLSSVLVAGLLLVLGTGCGDDAEDSASTDATSRDLTTPVAAPQDFSMRGPYAVGATRLELDEQRPVEVFYPADPGVVPVDAVGYRYTPEEVWGPLLPSLPPDVLQTVQVPNAWFDVPAGRGPFPLVVLSHGFGTMRFSYAFHAGHLASWGYVVASPEHPTRDTHARLGGVTSPPSDAATILDTVSLLTVENSRVGSVLEERVSGDQVAVEGFSAGGRDAALAALDTTVHTWIAVVPLAPVADDAAGGHDLIAEAEDGFDPATGEFDLAAYLARTAPPDKPAMMLVAEDDMLFPLSQQRAIFEWMATPKRFVVLADTGHLVFINECRGDQEHGGWRLGDALGFDPASVERRLMENGCRPSDAPVDDVWATWNHLTVAQLNSVFGLDANTAAASLERSYLDTVVPGRIADYVVEQANVP